MAREEIRSYKVHCAYSGCDVTAHVESARGAPKGWYQIARSVKHTIFGFAYDGDNPLEFHSLECVQLWSKEQQAPKSSKQPQATPPLKEEKQQEEKQEEISANGAQQQTRSERSREAALKANKKYAAEMPPQPAGLKGKEVLVWQRKEQAKIIRRKILEALKIIGEPVNSNQIAALVEVAQSSARRHLEELAEQGVVKTTTASVRGNANATLYSLA